MKKSDITILMFLILFVTCVSLNVYILVKSKQVSELCAKQKKISDDLFLKQIKIMDKTTCYSAQNKCSSEEAIITFSDEYIEITIGNKKKLVKWEEFGTTFADFKRRRLEMAAISGMGYEPAQMKYKK